MIKPEIIEKTTFENLYILNQALTTGMFTREFMQRDLEISTRVLHHWKNKGLLPDNQREGWKHKFNFIELIYLYTLVELRKIGLPIEKLKLVKKCLFEKVDLLELTEGKVEDMDKYIQEMGFEDPEEEKKVIDLFKSGKYKKPFSEMDVSVLEFFVLNGIQFRQQTNIVVFETGEAFMYNESMYSSEFLAKINNHVQIVIPLNRLLLWFLSDPENFKFASRYKILDETEVFILEQIRNGKAKAITVKFKNGQAVYLEIEKDKKVKLETRLQEILLKGEHEELIIKTQQGNIVYTASKRKIKLPQKNFK